jgi:hypothetical protein
MAKQDVTSGVYTSKETESIELGDAAAELISSGVLHVQGTAWTGSITPKGAARRSGLAPLALPYQNLRTLADVAAGTPITADGLYAIRADGLELTLEHVWVAGSVQIGVSRCVG